LKAAVEGVVVHFAVVVEAAAVVVVVVVEAAVAAVDVTQRCNLSWSRLHGACLSPPHPVSNAVSTRVFVVVVVVAAAAAAEAYADSVKLEAGAAADGNCPRWRMDMELTPHFEADPGFLILMNTVP